MQPDAEAAESPAHAWMADQIGPCGLGVVAVKYNNIVYREESQFWVE